MPRPIREFNLDGTGTGTLTGTSLRNVAQMLQPRFELAADRRPAAVRRTWLDTFDWRLYRAGLTLEYLSRREAAELVLVARDGARVVSAVPKTTWPSLVDGLPNGPVRGRIAPVAGIRALLPIVSGTGTRRTLRVVDGEEKTVARLTIDDAEVRGPAATAAAALSTRLSITAVRGYDAQADRIARLIGDLPGTVPAGGPALDAALTAAGLRPAPYTTRAVAELVPSMPAGTAVASVLLRLLDVAEANVDGVIHDIDTEFLHDFRVAVRRTRSALKLAGDALPGEMAARFAPEFRWLGQLTTPTRDLDVHLLGFERAAAGLVTAAPGDLAPLRDRLVRYRAAERRRLLRGLRSTRFGCLTSDWRAALGEVLTQPDKAGRRWAETAWLPVANLAAARIRRAHQRLTRAGGKVTPTSPHDDLHTVRKRGKELRYLLEFFATLHEPATHHRAVRELKQLQDCLGDIQDGHVQCAAIRALAARMLEERAAAAATLLAMGELAAQLDASARNARTDFARRFARFTSARNTRRITLLTEVAA